MSYDDFCGLTPEEFAATCKAYNIERDADYKSEWERMRMLATITIQPHLKKKMTPRSLLPFPWEAAPKPKVKVLSREEERARVQELMKRLDR